MGSSTLIDLIGSMVIGSLLLLVAMRMNDAATRNTFESQENLTVQQNLTSLVMNIESDFRKIGYCADPAVVPMSDSMIIHGDSTSITFLASLYPEKHSNPDRLDTVTWWWDTAHQIYASKTQGDTAIHMLYREVGYSDGAHKKYGSNLGVAEFRMTYYKTGADQSLDTLNKILVVTAGDTTSEAKFIQIDLKVEPTAAYDTAYSSNYAYWRQIMLTSMNLVNR